MILVYFFIGIFLTMILCANFLIKNYIRINVLISVILVFFTPFVSFFIFFKSDFGGGNQSIDSEPIIVILGAGINNNDTPTDILKRRLESGFEIYNQNKYKIIVTGDNSQQDHNEPRVMKNYLIKLGVSGSDITEDFGGRRTMDSCYRVKNFFDAKKIILVSQAFHLPRARFLCESVGLEVQTKVSQDANFGTAAWGYMREIPASWSALWDSIYFVPQVGSNGREVVK
jgi:vancomycin permeability regulator SanA